MIDAIQDVERRGLRPGRIVMTQKQRAGFILKESHLALSCGVGPLPDRYFGKFMGCKIQVDDAPRWCVEIEDEW